jgi:hypothetical protein
MWAVDDAEPNDGQIVALLRIHILVSFLAIVRGRGTDEDSQQTGRLS